MPTDDEDARAAAGAEAYVRALSIAMTSAGARPVALIAVTKSGPVSIIDRNFPRDAIPTREEWNAMYPGPDSSVVMTIRVRRGQTDDN